MTKGLGCARSLAGDDTNNGLEAARLACHWVATAAIQTDSFLVILVLRGLGHCMRVMQERAA